MHSTIANEFPIESVTNKILLQMFKFKFYFFKFCHLIMPRTCITKKRHCTALFICSGFLITHAMRTNLSYTALRMLDKNPSTLNATTNTDKVNNK